MIKTFYLNKKGKIEFTKEELEKLLNEVWHDGKNSTFTWTSPYYWSTSPTITCGSLNTATGVTTTTATVNADNINPVQVRWKYGDATNATRNDE